MHCFKRKKDKHYIQKQLNIETKVGGGNHFNRSKKKKKKTQYG